MTVAYIDQYRPEPEPAFTPEQQATIGQLQDCIDAIASRQVVPTALVIGLARANDEPIILTSSPTTLEAFDEILTATDSVSRAVRNHAGRGSPTQEQLMAVIRDSWVRQPPG